ncbi:unnamed protein product [Brassica oleracea var. botrytis]|uniref:Uncharacterized protein n=1 Tax=Brassica oleracea var. oleracea TaxID=109376 RepID=A0A0D3A8V3_BRAOL
MKLETSGFETSMPTIGFGSSNDMLDGFSIVPSFDLPSTTDFDGLQKEAVMVAADSRTLIKAWMHKGLEDPLEVVGLEIADEAILLCLDEFMVNDVAAALILNRLFRHLFNNGIERCVVREIGSSVDYRKLTFVSNSLILSNSV